MELLKPIEAEINQDFEDKIKDYKQCMEESSHIKEKWKQEIKNAVSKCNASTSPMPEKVLEPEKPSKNRLLVNDATVEILAQLTAKNLKGILYFRDELSGWLEGMNQYKGKGGSDRSFWLEAYNGNSFVVDRIKLGIDGSISVPSLFIPVIGGIQPDKLQKALLNDTDDGMTARFVYLWPKTVPPKRPIFFADNTLAMKALRKLQELPVEINNNGQPTPTIITLAESALPHFEKLRQDIYNKEKAASGLYLSYMGKNGGRALRLALILEMLWWSGGDETIPPLYISEDAILCAQDMISNYFDPMARRAFDNASLSPEVRDAITIAKWLARTKVKKINSREIQRASLGGMKSAKKVQEALDELENANWITPDPENNNTGGRPRKDYLVNPKIYEKL